MFQHFLHYTCVLGITIFVRFYTRPKFEMRDFMLFMLDGFHFAQILRSFVFVKTRRATREKWFKNNALKVKWAFWKTVFNGTPVFSNRLWNSRVYIHVCIWQILQEVSCCCCCCCWQMFFDTTKIFRTLMWRWWPLFLPWHQTLMALAIAVDWVKLTSEQGLFSTKDTC